MSNLSNNTLESALVPLNSFCLGDSVGCTNSGLAAASLGDTFTRTSPKQCKIDYDNDFIAEHSHAAVEIHAVNTN